MNLIGGRNCIHCGKRLPTEDLGQRDRQLACCGCGAPMTPRRLEETLFDECDRCGGLWLCPATVSAVRSGAEDRARLRAFDLLPRAGPAAKGAATAQGSAAGGYRRCPLCGKHMNRSNYARGAGVVVDVCKDHGSFFDRGELTRIFQFIEDGGLEKMRQRAEEEQRSVQRNARREAIRIGTADAETSFTFGGQDTGLDLLGWLSRVIVKRLK
jgi:Zn-finger nucleic acid-binding protein